MPILDPTAIETRVYRDGEIIYWPHWQSIDGESKEPIVNPAGGILPKPMVEPLAVGIIHGHKWVSAYSDAQYKNQLNATNADGWRSWGVGQAWISRIITANEERDGVSVVHIHYIIRCNEYGWKSTMPWMGYFYDDAGDKKAFLTQDDVPYIGLLDAGGAETFTPVISDLDLKRQISFASELGF